ncbi:MAG: DUF885 domain-containing protein [Actinomycetota bacterium]|nr:DUF885 domain-containing protein [Actinomycetota bacterium]
MTEIPSSDVYDIADRYVDQIAALDPIAATGAGIAGHDHELTDYSPAGADARAQLARDTLTALAAAPSTGDADRIAAGVMAERLQLAVDQHEAGERLRDVRVIGSPVQSVRQCFDLMAYDTPEDWDTVRERMRRVPEALAGIELALREGIGRGVVSTKRQTLACATQAEVWSSESPFFRELAARHPGDSRLADAAEDATTAYADIASFLRDEYALQAEEHDPVGRDRYELFARYFNGIDLDFEETYDWGWEQLYSIERAMGEVGERILPGESLPAVFEYLENDEHRSVEGVEAFQRWNQNLIDTTISELNGTHFDIADRLLRCEAMIAPPGGAAAMYYTGPSEDFTRPGRTWYPTLGKTRFPLWREVSICYHESVPGHHLQVGQVRHLADKLSRYQRAFGFVSGHGEGWALYAERLMAELGYLDDPAWEMGMLSAQAMRAVRVIVDIGMHLELPSREHDGARWTPELALPFVIERSRFPENFMRSEVDRYLGWPGQAISYKVGERVWLEARADAERRHGADFDLKAFHTYALDLGSMGLSTLQEELTRF